MNLTTKQKGVLRGMIIGATPAILPGTFLLAVENYFGLNQDRVIFRHLHLLALQKAVYLGLGMNDELAEVIANDNKLPGGFYKRAWEIVNQGE